MGQEWAASTPFLFFTDFEAGLGRLVTEGRRREFQAFAAFRDPAARERIPDPQALETFARSRLDWSELAHEAHAAALACTRALLRLRREEPALRNPARGATEVVPLDDGTLMLWREAAASAGDDRPGGPAPAGGQLAAVVALRGAPRVTVPAAPDGRLRPGVRWVLRLTTEDSGFDPAPRPPRVAAAGASVEIAFERPGAVVLVQAREARR
jgi:maltooligosyltrehalose trehalohydrolase